MSVLKLSDLKKLVEKNNTIKSISEEIIQTHIINGVIPSHILDNVYNRMITYKDFHNSETIFIVDISKVDVFWKKDPHFYISPILEKRNNNGKYLASKRDIINNKVDEPPRIAYSKDDNVIRFTNGRNRFANFRDNLYKSIPVIIEKHQIDIFRQLFEYADG